tara:strand:+ start:256 stop:582 length:327 start_codon:yes stop_codon:yes gene_type:complete
MAQAQQPWPLAPAFGLAPAFWHGWPHLGGHGALPSAPLFPGGARPVAPLYPSGDTALAGVPTDQTQVSSFVNALLIFLIFLGPLTERFRPMNDTVLMPLLLTMVMGGM